MVSTGGCCETPARLASTSSFHQIEKNPAAKELGIHVRVFQNHPQQFTKTPGERGVGGSFRMKIKHRHPGGGVS